MGVLVIPHSPGSWSRLQTTTDATVAYTVHDADGHQLAHVEASGSPMHDRANAALMAHAVTLLARLKTLVEAIEDQLDGGGLVLDELRHDVGRARTELSLVEADSQPAP